MVVGGGGWCLVVVVGGVRWWALGVVIGSGARARQPAALVGARHPAWLERASRHR